MSKFQQVGLSETKTAVGNPETGVIVGYMLQVTFPKSSGGIYSIETKDPVPEDKVEWTLKQFRADIWHRVSKSRGIIDHDFRSYLDMSKVRAA